VKVLAKHKLLGSGEAQTSRVIVQSFELSSLELMAKLAPTVPRAYLFSANATPTHAVNSSGSGTDPLAAKKRGPIPTADGWSPKNEQGRLRRRRTRAA